MKTMLRILLVSAMVALPYGIAKADPVVHGLIQIDNRPQYDEPTVNIWTDAGRYFIGESVQITVTVDRPGFVTVYNIDAAGRVRRLTRDPQGAWVTPGRPLYLPENRYSQLVAGGPAGTEELIAVASRNSFANCNELKYYGDGEYDDFQSCDRDRDGFIVRVNRRLMHGRDFSARSVARTTFLVQAPWFPPDRPSGFHISIGIDIPLSAQVYADGVFLGIGPQCIYGLAPGSHKLTVRTERGRKITRQIDIPRDSRYRSDVRNDRDRESNREKQDRKEVRQEWNHGKKR